MTPRVRRILAPNPSAFTFTGTQTHIVGSGEVAVIDPGPNNSVHVAALLRALEGERVAAIVCTHTHVDHSPAAQPLAEATGAPIIGCAPLLLEEVEGDESYDTAYAPDRVLADGERLEGAGWTLEAVATPGHTSNHLCFALPEERILFSGDHVMGWSTSIVSPPDGDMADYRQSLAKLLERDDSVYYPAHGDPIDEPLKYVRGLILHRSQREAQIMRELAGGPATVAAIVANMYRNVDPRLHPAAERSVLAHLIELRGRGSAVEEGGEWHLQSA